MAVFQERITRITLWVALAASLMVAFGPPSLYLALSLKSLDASLKIETSVTAGLVTRVVETAPQMWRYEEHRLRDLVERRAFVEMSGANTRILDAGGGLVLESRAPATGPFLTESHPIFDAGQPAGRVEISRSIRGILFQTLLVGAASLSAGVLLFFLFRAYPIRALSRFISSLTQEQRWYRALFDESNDLIFVHEVIGRGPGPILEANQLACQRLGYSPEELVGKNFVHITAPEALPEPGVFRLLLETGQTLFGSVLVGKDGRRVPVEIGARILNRDGTRVLLAVARDMTERRMAEERLREALRGKETLLREIHHRVKNNLQVISGLLDLQSRFLKNPEDRQVFRESQARIRTMSLVHERLYRSDDLEKVEMSQYLRELTGQLVLSLSVQRSDVTLAIEADEAQLPVDTVIPLGLVINELISNAFKHAFPEGQAGKVSVRFRALPENRYRLEVEDDGKGLPPGIDPWKVKSLGMRLIVMLTQQMGGEVRISSENGASFSLEFPEYRGSGQFVSR